MPDVNGRAALYCVTPGSFSKYLYDSLEGENVTLLGDADHPSNVMNAVWQAYECARKL